MPKIQRKKNGFYLGRTGGQTSCLCFLRSGPCPTDADSLCEASSLSQFRTITAIFWTRNFVPAADLSAGNSPDKGPARTTAGLCSGCFSMPRTVLPEIRLPILTPGRFTLPFVRKRARSRVGSLIGIYGH